MQMHSAPFELNASSEKRYFDSKTVYHPSGRVARSLRSQRIQSDPASPEENQPVLEPRAPVMYSSQRSTQPIKSMQRVKQKMMDAAAVEEEDDESPEIEPHENDVLMGRGGKVSTPGRDESHLLM